MIEDKSIGLKIAENPEEEVWETIRDNTEKRILQTEIQLDIDKQLIKYVKSKLKLFSKS